MKVSPPGFRRAEVDSCGCYGAMLLALIPLYLLIAGPDLGTTRLRTIVAVCIVLPCLILVVRWLGRSFAEASRTDSSNEGLLPFRMQIWSEASICLRCYVAFWPTSTGYSHAVPIDQFHREIWHRAAQLQQDSQDPNPR